MSLYLVSIASLQEIRTEEAQDIVCRIRFLRAVNRCSRCGRRRRIAACPFTVGKRCVIAISKLRIALTLSSAPRISQLLAPTLCLRMLVTAQICYLDLRCNYVFVNPLLSRRQHPRHVGRAALLQSRRISDNPVLQIPLRKRVMFRHSTRLEI